MENETNVSSYFIGIQNIINKVYEWIKETAQKVLRFFRTHILSNKKLVNYLMEKRSYSKRVRNRQRLYESRRKLGRRI